MKNTFFYLSIIPLLINSGNAALVADSTFGTVTDTNENNALFNFADNGWYTKVPASWGTGSGEATRGDANGAIAQLNTITTETGNAYNLAFDWTAAIGVSGANLEVYARVVAWSDGGASATDETFRFINSNDASGVRSLSGGSYIDLSDGSTSTGNSNLDKFTFVGTAGSTETASFTLNFDGTNIEDYDYIGIRFDAPRNSAGVLDNVTITPIPEPGATALLGLGLLAMARRRR